MVCVSQLTFMSQRHPRSMAEDVRPRKAGELAGGKQQNWDWNLDLPNSKSSMPPAGHFLSVIHSFFSLCPLLPTLLALNVSKIPVDSWLSLLLSGTREKLQKNSEAPGPGSKFRINQRLPVFQAEARVWLSMTAPHRRKGYPGVCCKDGNAKVPGATNRNAAAGGEAG